MSRVTVHMGGQLNWIVEMRGQIAILVACFTMLRLFSPSHVLANAQQQTMSNQNGGCREIAS